MGHVFLSYSHRDRAYAATLATEIRAQGIKVWVDNEIDYGTRFTKKIRKHLDGCDAVVVIMSPEAEDSEWVANEVERAKRKGKPIIPLRLRGETWLQFETTQHLDVTQGQLPPRSFYRRLEAIVAGRPEPRGSSERYDVPILAAEIGAALGVGPPPYRHGHPALHVRWTSDRPFPSATACEVVIVRLGRGYLALASVKEPVGSTSGTARAVLESRGWSPIGLSGPIQTLRRDGFTPSLAYPALSERYPGLSRRQITRIASRNAVAHEVAALFVEVLDKPATDVTVEWRNHLSSFLRA